jgi:23S rRNA (uracil1939-C5)-methyltransferase
MSGSSGRQITDCPLRALKCGGCPLLGVPYAEQLMRKQRRITAFYPHALPIAGMKMPYHYRNKAISTFAASGNGLISGLYAQGSHHVLPVESCLLENERAGRIVCIVRAILRRYPIQAYHEDLHTGTLRHLVVRRAHATGAALVTIVTASKILPFAESIVKDIIRECPDVVTIVQNINPRQTSAVLGYTERILSGPGYIEDILCGCVFRLSSRSFYQINSSQTEKLYRYALDMADLTGRESAIDAYCGIGTIGIIAARKAGNIIGIELNAAAVLDAGVNAVRNGIANISFIKGDAGQVMGKMPGPPDVLFLDPPRSGCDDAFLSAVCKRQPRRIVYISCDIETLARDTRILCDGGYTVGAVRGVDMFPHTNHVECVVLMSRVTE